jgi:DnaD/phage-associated family protein
MNEEYIPEGYILLARKIRKSPLWKALKATHRIVMIEILLQSQFQDTKVVRNGQIIQLNRGQVATSYQQLVDDIGDKDITVKVVRNAIEKLVKYDFLAKDEAKAKAKQGLLLTVVNYDVYQNSDNYKGKDKGKETGITGAKEGQSEGKAGAINNNVNEFNNVNNDEFISSDSSSAREIFNEFEQAGFGTLTSIITDRINDLVNDYGQTWVLESMKIASYQNKRSLSYIDGILKRWRAEGIDEPWKGGKTNGKSRDVTRHDPETSERPESYYDQFPNLVKRI